MFFRRLVWLLALTLAIIASPAWACAAGQAADSGTSSQAGSSTQSGSAASPQAGSPGQSGSSTSAPQPSSPKAAPLEPVPYGNGKKQSAKFVTTGPPINFLTFGADFTSEYDSNLLDTRIGDVGYIVSPQVAMRRDGERWGLAFDYRPTFLFYSHHSSLNRHNQDLNADASFQATQRLEFRARTVFSQYSGFLTPFLRPSTVSGLSSPGGANGTLLVPDTSQLEDDSRLDVSYRMGFRSSFDVFGNYLTRTFGQVPNHSYSLLNTQGHTFGAEYMREMSPTMSVGVVYTYENFHSGPNTRVGLNIPSGALAWQLSPRLILNVFAGPVYTQLRTVELVPFGPYVLGLPVARTDWHWAAGGSLAEQGRANAIMISGSRQVTDGGGLLTAVEASQAALTWNRRVARGWTIEWSGGWERNTGLLSGNLSGQFNGEYGRAVILHKLSPGLSAGIGYEYQRQRGTGSVPIFATFDRNLAYFTMTYNFRQIPLGR